MIIQKLKEWRDDLAFKAGKPAYYILTNKNLEDALKLNPENPGELEKLSGWGPKKVEKYGAEVLNIINQEPGNSNQESDKNNFELNSKQEQEESNRAILSVAQYVNFINVALQQYGEIKVTGEINDLGGTDRGLAFFDLKDKDDHESTMQCVVYRNNFNYLSHLLKDGLEVVVYGLPSIYSKNGNFKFAVTRIEPVGEGSYKKALEILKQKLIQKGYFSEERKRPLPAVIKKIGLITSGSGAAIQDFKRNLSDFGFEVFLKNVYVEGDQAESSIIEAINFFNKQSDQVDILAVIRGGGSWESLKAYNSEKVVEAIVASKIPVITGVGHESDETFAGLSSDYDCSTPSIVATFLSRTREDLLRECQNNSENLIDATQDYLETQNSLILNQLRILSSGAERVFNQFNQKSQAFLNLMSEKIFQVDGILQSLNIFKQKLSFRVENNLKIQEDFLVNSKNKIDILNPQNILEKGYSIIYSQSGKILDSVKKTKIGDKIKVQLKDGEISVGVDKIDSSE